VGTADRTGALRALAAAHPPHIGRPPSWPDKGPKPGYSCRLLLLAHDALATTPRARTLTVARTAGLKDLLDGPGWRNLAGFVVLIISARFICCVAASRGARNPSLSCGLGSPSGHRQVNYRLGCRVIIVNAGTGNVARTGRLLTRPPARPGAAVKAAM
jgi:hypothetical protein